MCKKILSVLITICILLNYCVVYAESSLIIKLDTIEVNAGDEFEVNLSLENNPGIASFTIKLKFDKNVMTPVSYTNKSNFTSTVNIDSKDVDLNSIDQINIFYDSMEDITTNGVVGTIKFRAASNVDISESKLVWLTEDKTISVFNSTFDDIQYSLVDGVVKFKTNSDSKESTTELASESTTESETDKTSEITTENNKEGELVFLIDNVEVNKGDEFEVNLSLENNPGIASFTMKLKFDKNVLTPVSYTNKSNFTSTTNIDSKDVDLNSVDQINILYDSMENINTNGVVGTIKFKSATNVDVSNTKLEWVANDNTISVFNNSFDDIPYILKNGIVKFKNNSMPSYSTTESTTELSTELITESTSENITEQTDHNNKLVFYLNDIEANKGEEVDVNIYIRNNPGIASFMMKLEFDKNVLTPVSYTNKSNFTSTTNIDSEEIDLNSINQISILYDSMENINTNGVVGTIKFRIKDNTELSETNLKWLTNDATIVVFDSNFDDIEYDVTDGTIKLKDSAYNESTESSTELSTESSTESTSESTTERSTESSTESTSESTTERSTESSTESTSESSTEEIILTGDANLDGYVNEYDAILLLKKTLDNSVRLPIENKTSKWIKYVDLDFDKKVTSNDAAIVFKRCSKK